MFNIVNNAIAKQKIPNLLPKSLKRTHSFSFSGTSIKDITIKFTIKSLCC